MHHLRFGPFKNIGNGVPQKQKRNRKKENVKPNLHFMTATFRSNSIKSSFTHSGFFNHSEVHSSSVSKQTLWSDFSCRHLTCRLQLWCKLHIQVCFKFKKFTRLYTKLKIVQSGLGHFVNEPRKTLMAF